MIRLYMHTMHDIDPLGYKTEISVALSWTLRQLPGVNSLACAILVHSTITSRTLPRRGYTEGL